MAQRGEIRDDASYNPTLPSAGAKPWTGGHEARIDRRAHRSGQPDAYAGSWRLCA
jgi:hypothetical protein